MEKEILTRKKEEVKELSEKISSMKSVVAFDYIGLTVEKFTELRRNLRSAGCEIKVYKNNIVRRASVEAGYEGLAQYMVGAKALAYSATDVVAPARIVYEFSKTNDAVAIKAGIVEGKVYDEKEMNEIATLPSFETLLTMLASGMLSPIRDLAIGLNMMTEEASN